jgi:hypothetical protein
MSRTDFLLLATFIFAAQIMPKAGIWFMAAWCFVWALVFFAREALR